MVHMPVERIIGLFFFAIYSRSGLLVISPEDILYFETWRFSRRSAEELSKFFAETLAKKLSETYDNLEYVAVCVNEGIGQGAEYRKDL